MEEILYRVSSFLVNYALSIIGKDVNNLKKFFYLLGVYNFCVAIHEGELSTLYDEIKSIAKNIREIVDICKGRERELERHKEIKQQTGFTPKKVVNKIGF